MRRHEEKIRGRERSSWDQRKKQEAKVRCGVFFCQEESRFPKELFEDWCEEVVEDGFGSCESGGRASCGYCAHRKGLKLRRQMQARKGRCRYLFSLKVNGLEVEEDLPTMATLFWAEGVWMGRW